MWETSIIAAALRRVRIGWEGAALASLALVLVVLRLHTLSEPLDCDEAAYAYVAHRLLEGDRLYEDVFENKPPLAYAPYALAIRWGGYNERSIRLLPIPFCLLTLWAVWRTARLLAAPPGALIAGALYAILQADPYVFGNGANLELYMSPFLTLALWLLVRSRVRGAASRSTLLLLGLFIGLATAIKQVAALYAIYALAVLVVRPAWRGRRFAWAVGAAGTLLFGCALPWFGMVAYCWQQGTLYAFLEAVFVYAPQVSREASEALFDRYGALLSDARTAGPAMLPAAVAIAPTPSRLMAFAQWLVLGNPMANAWWGTVIWPALLVALRMVIRSFLLPAAVPGSVVVSGWLLVTVAVIAWPRLFWQHYYMLLVPAVAILAGRLVAEAWMLRLPRRFRFRLSMLRALLVVALLLVPGLMIYCYALRDPDMITTQCKGGRQWVALRGLGTKLAAAFDADTRLFVWGWQSPLHFYSGFDSVTPFFFTDPLMQAYVHEPHPAADRRKARIIRDLSTQLPGLVFVGEEPFERLRLLLRSEYVKVDAIPFEWRGLYVRRDLALELLGPAAVPLW